MLAAAIDRFGDPEVLIVHTLPGLDGLELVREMGADLAIDSRHEDVAAGARRFAPNAIDAVLALAGGDAASDSAIEAVRRGGRVAYPNGIEPEPEKRRGVKFIACDGVSGVREFERLNQAVRAAKLKVPISERFPLAGTAKAHEHLAAGHVLGKTILRIQLL
jgi:NADPH:quinone reductase-like Zn-dependent oxidoreductase